MIVSAVMEGWGSSSKSGSTSLSEIVREAILQNQYKMLFARALFSSFRSKTFKRFILKNQDSSNDLFLAGKSLGAKNIVGVINSIDHSLRYRKIVLLTVDPNWPARWDLTPNLNGKSLELKAHVDKAINVYLVGLPGQQCGSRLSGSRIENRAIMTDGYTHKTVVSHPAVEEAVEDLIGDLNA